MSHTIIEGFPLSPQQARGWQFQQPGPGLYAETVVAIDGPLDVARLDRAVDLVVRRHEIFRTAFHALPEMQLPLQVIDSGRPPLLTRVDARGRSDAGALALVRRVAARDRATPWDFGDGPLMRCVLVEQSADRHVLVVTLPSMCADHRTLTNVVREIAAAYASAGDATRAGGLDPEPLQYVEFAEWQREMTAAEPGADARRFWQQQEARPTERSAFAGLFKEHAGGPFKPEAATRDLEPARVRRVGMLTNRHHLSDSAFWMACWYVVMRRLVAQPDLVIGRVFHGRRYPETQDGMGPVARCVPIRCQAEATTTFVDAAKRLHQAIREADTWQELYDQAAGERPLAFEVHEWPALRRAGDLQFRTEQQICHLEPFLLKLTCLCCDPRLRLELHFDSSSVSPTTAEWLLDHLLRAAEGVVADPEARIDSLELLTETQRRQMVVGFNDTSRPLIDAARPLPWHVEAQAARTPDAAAVVYGTTVVTFADLDRWAAHIARELQARGVTSESRVGVVMRRSPRLLAALLGVMKAGGAYVPLDPADPAGRTAAVLEDAGAALVLSDETVPDLPEAPAIDECAEASLPPAPDSLAYVIYTSGSTGTPKGALITHRGLMNYLLWAVEAYAIADGHGAPLHSPIAFDLSVTSLFAPLLTGHPVTLAPDPAPGDALARVLREDGGRFSFVKIAPAHLQALSWQVPPAVWGARTRALIIGGEALHAETLRGLRDAAPDVRIYNEYGPTETVVGSCVFELTPTTPHAGAVPIGRPIANTQLYVVDRPGHLVPPGVDGELLIGGAGLARGYLNRPDLTAERFVPDPFGAVPGARLYRTGDVVRWRSDGALVYVGRVDNQVKVRGYRIELGEIEAVLRTVAGVKDVALIVREDTPGDRRLVAYLVADRASRQPADRLREALAARLPQYMLPAGVVWLDALPLTRNGKVDRRALPAPERTPDRSMPLVRASTPVEDVLAAIWADILNVEDVSVHDNFFALGGDSIRAIQVCARAEQRGLPLTHEQLFEHQTLAALARVLAFDAAPLAAAAPLEPFALVPDEDRAVVREELDDAYPLSALQAGMVFHTELAPESAIFHDIHSFVMRGPFELDVMRLALGDVMKRHAVLRTAFELSRYSRPLQLVYREVTPPLDVTDLRALAADDQRAAIDAWLRAERTRPFDWRQPPLVRFHVHRLGDEQFQFTMSFHHAMLDGWSAASLLTELFNRCRTRYEQPNAAAPPPLACSFRDFVALEGQADASNECRQFWRDQLQSVSRAPLPRRRRSGADGDTPSEGMVVVPVDMPDEVVAGLRRLTRSAALPLKSVALAAHAKVLAIETNQPFVVTGMVSHGRPEVLDGDRVLGLFLNTVPCVIPVGPGRWRDLAQAAFESERRVWRFRRYPLARLQREHGAPIFDVGFNFMHYHVYQGVQQSETAQVEGYTGYEETDLPLTANFFLEPDTGHLRLSLHYRPSELAAAQVAEIAERYRMVLAAIAADPESRHTASPLLTPAERDRILGAWSGSEVRLEAPLGDSVVARLEAAAQRAPDADAVTFGDQSLRAADLHARANRLARHLQTLQVGPETLVAVALDRSPELIVAVLAILKAGGAYVPLDLSNPPGRLALVLADAQPRVVITRQSLAPLLPAHDAATLRIDEDWPAIAACPPDPLPPIANAANRAYVIYTSGSTGTPKGVQVTHGGLRNYLQWCLDAYGVTPGDGAPLHSSVAFDLSVTSLFVPLLAGAPIALVPESTLGAELASMLREGRHFGFIKLTPAHLQALALQVPPASIGERAGVLVVGGEALHAEALRAWWDAAPGLRIFNEYGPTETVVGSVVYEARADAAAAGPVPIGRPIHNTRVFVLDRAGHPVPPGVDGELFIGGAGVARGYLNRPELTAERFVPDPFSALPGARFYRTGDIARWREDGLLEYVGRRDQQVKIRGYRVELGDVEAALRQQTGVRDAVAMLREDVAGDRRLVAYLVAVDAPVAGEALQQTLRDVLPDYLMPSAVVWLDALPLTANGKVDRRRLPAPTGDRPVMAEAYLAPRTPVEEQLARIWSDVLRVERIGVEDNFFALGGHSLTAMQVIARVRDAFVVDLPLRPLFESPTIAQVARLIEEARTGPAANEAAEFAAIPADSVTDVDQLLDELESLEADEVRSLLGGQR